MKRCSGSRGIPRGLPRGFSAAKLPEELDGAQRHVPSCRRNAPRIAGHAKIACRWPQLIQEAMRRTGYDAMLLAEFLGERKLANLHKLIEQAQSFDRRASSRSPTSSRNCRVRRPAARRGAGRDAARIGRRGQANVDPSIEGLEFPVVIVPDVGRPRRRMGPPVAFTPELGPMLKDEDVTTGYDLFMAAENEEDLEEHTRLLYVATTRAADYLILSAGVESIEDLEKPAGPWMELLAKSFDLVKGERRGERGERERGEERGTNVRLSIPKSPSLRALPSPLSPLPSPLKITIAIPLIQSKPIDLRNRRNLMKIVEKAEQMAADGQGKRPQHLVPVPGDPGARRQYSFSRLTGKLQAKTSGIEAGPLETDSPGEPPLDARGLGTLVHAVLAEIDFAKPGDIEELLRQLAPQHLSRSERRLDEPIRMIQGFLSSSRGKQLAAAKAVHKELEFLLAWPPGDRQPGGRFLQGFIDCLYLDAAGQWRLIDYKTNRGVTAETLAAKASPYEMQMLVYALAAETILKTPPAELALCFLQPGLEYRFSWDDAARRRVVELVGEAMFEERHIE